MQDVKPKGCKAVYYDIRSRRSVRPGAVLVPDQIPVRVWFEGDLVLDISAEIKSAGGQVVSGAIA